MPPARRRPKSLDLAWTQASLASIVLIAGSEGLLGDRAVSQLVRLARQSDPDVEITRIEAAGYEPAMLDTWASPSLFGEARLVVVDGVESTNDAFLADALNYLSNPADGLWLVLRHGGGVRGKKLLDAVRSSGAPVIGCEPVKRDSDKIDFVGEEFRQAGRHGKAAAATALVEAVGGDLRELAAACAQLISDTQGEITVAMVDRYHGGRVEATGFRVADAAVAGKTGEAISLLRHALDTGVDPVPLVAVLAMKLRALAKVAAMRGRGADAMGSIGMAPWQADRARKELAQWTPEGLAAAIQAVARADSEVKGAGRDPIFAVERAVLAVCSAHGN